MSKVVEMSSKKVENQKTKDVMKEKKQEFKNPAEYGYRPDDTVEMTGNSYSQTRQVNETLLEQETKVFYPQIHKYVKADGSDVTREELSDESKRGEITEMIAMGQIKKIIDIEATFNAEPVIYRTRLGMELLHNKRVLEQIHLDSIDNGTAVHVEELKKEFEEMSNNNPNIGLRADEKEID
jgi:hypothetical protein